MSKEDQIFHLGDVSFKNQFDWRSKLNGNITVELNILFKKIVNELNSDTPDDEFIKEMSYNYFMLVKRKNDYTNKSKELIKPMKYIDEIMKFI